MMFVYVKYVKMLRASSIRRDRCFVFVMKKEVEERGFHIG